LHGNKDLEFNGDGTDQLSLHLRNIIAPAHPVIFISDIVDLDTEAIPLCIICNMDARNRIGRKRITRICLTGIKQSIYAAKLLLNNPGQLLYREKDL